MTTDYKYFKHREKREDLFNLNNNMDTKIKLHKLAMSTLGIKIAFLTISRVKF